MAYIGNIPAESYASFETETFSVSATANYTLSHAVTNENEIRLVINGVVQQPGSGKAYTASGTTLTLTSATVSGDVMYAVYLGRALQTVNPPNASVGSDQTAPTIITGQTAEATIATDDTILIHDTSASALRKMTRANFVSGIGGTNTPAFHAFVNSAQSIGTNSDIKIINFNEVVDTNSAFASNKFTVPSGEGGKYIIYGCVSFASDVSYPHAQIFVNGSGSLNSESLTGNMGDTARSCFTSRIITLAASDYVEIYTFQGSGATNTEASGRTFFGGYKLIGV